MDDWIWRGSNAYSPLSKPVISFFVKVSLFDVPQYLIDTGYANVLPDPNHGSTS